MTPKTENITQTIAPKPQSGQTGNYIIATSRSWNEEMADRLSYRLDTRFDLITTKNNLSVANLKQLQPCFIFFPHWSYIIPAEIYEQYECVIFHMTDLPYGRGGSPLQNLISRGIEETKITALRCVGEVDAGPIYMKRPLSLKGSAEEIFLRAGRIIEEMIVEMVTNEPELQEQVGEPTIFKRRRPHQSEINDAADLKAVYDHIRMLDAEGYPHAFIETGGFRYEFKKASNDHDGVNAEVTITRVKNE